MRALISSFLLSGLICCCQLGFAQQQNIDPVALVRHATQNEIAATGPTKPPFFMYKDHTQYSDHSITTESIETTDGGLNRTLAKNGKPLSPQEQADADQKLKSFAYDKDARRKKRQSNRDDDQRSITLMRSLPDAFNYSVTGVSKAPNGHEMVRLAFKAKPGWSAPTHDTRVLEGMDGNMVIDQTAGRIAEINGELFKDVDFGWGILGRLFKGGKFIIHQAEVGQGKWEETQERLQFNGKILMVKSLTIDSNETMSDFRPVPSNITTAQALQLLQNPDEVVAQNAEGSAGKQ
ncbi:MAG: hypothetical protein WAM71_18935 [Candidatus Korobacteraceae bacterium]